MATTKKPSAKAATGPRLEVAAPADKSPDRLKAELMIEGGAANAYLTRLFSSGTFGDVSLTDCMAVLSETSAAVKGGNLGAAEGLLVAQAVALNAIFGELSRRASLNMGEYMGAMETYLRLALKAQAQCRVTLETLAAIKNPPVVYARQANIAHGPQQVNNGEPGEMRPLRADARPRAGNFASAPSELLERQHGQGMDPRAQSEAGGADPRVEAVGKVHRPADC